MDNMEISAETNLFEMCRVCCSRSCKLHIIEGHLLVNYETLLNENLDEVNILPQYICFLCKRKIENAICFIEASKRSHQFFIKQVDKRIDFSEKKDFRKSIINCYVNNLVISDTENIDIIIPPSEVITLDDSSCDEDDLANASNDINNDNDDNNYMDEEYTEEIFEIPKAQNKTEETEVTQMEIIEFMNKKIAKEHKLPESFEVQHLNDQEQKLFFEKRRLNTSYRQLELKCEICYQAFLSEANLEHHSRKHTRSGKFKCSLCQFVFYTRAVYVAHLGTHSTLYKCKLCDYDTLKMSLAEKHTCGRSSIPVKNFFCNLCFKILPSETQYLIHSCDNVPPTFDCELCKASRLEKDEMKTHMRTQHPEVVEKGNTIKSNEDHFMLSKGKNTTEKENKVDNKTTDSQQTDLINKDINKKEQDRKEKRVKRQSEIYKTIKMTPAEQMENFLKRRDDSTYKKAPFRCELCYKGFYNLHSYKTHNVRHSEVHGLFECDYCQLRFSDRNKCSTHALNNHKLIFQCKLCDFRTTTYTSTTSHYRSHLEKKRYKCKICGIEYGFLSSYLGHMRLKHPSPQCSCPLCGYAFLGPKGLANHKTLIHLNDNRTVGDDSPLCDRCNVQFYDNEVLMTHIDAVHNNTAPNQFGNTYKPQFRGLRKPIKTKPFNCEICNEEMLSFQQYKLHFKRKHPDQTRTKKQDYSVICDICGKKYGCRAVLIEHIQRTHENKPIRYNCKICGKKFANKSNVGRHVNDVHKYPDKVPCKICGKEVSCPSSLKLHVDHVHNGKPYKPRIRKKL